MESLVTKDVNFNGDLLKVAQDSEGKIWVGIKWVCKGIGLTVDQTKAQKKKIAEDIVLSKGGTYLTLPTNGGEQEVACLQLDYLPLWLAKISITPKMKSLMPETVDKLIYYQLKAKDVLAEAFFSKKTQENAIVPTQTIQLSLPQIRDYSQELELVNQGIDGLYAKMDPILEHLVNIEKRLLKMEKRSEIPESVKCDSDVYKDWINEVNSFVDRLIAYDENLTSRNQVLSYVYGYMTKVYGIVWDEEIKECKEKNNFSSYTTKIQAIYYKGKLRSIFEAVLADFPKKITTKKVNTVKKSYIEKVSTGRTLEEIIKPLGDRYNDKSLHYGPTFSRVYKIMGIDWSKYPGVRKSHAIAMDRELRTKFEDTVKQLMEP